MAGTPGEEQNRGLKLPCFHLWRTARNRNRCDAQPPGWASACEEKPQGAVFSSEYGRPFEAVAESLIKSWGYRDLFVQPTHFSKTQAGDRMSPGLLAPRVPSPCQSSFYPWVWNFVGGPRIEWLYNIFDFYWPKIILCFTLQSYALSLYVCNNY